MRLFLGITFAYAGLQKLTDPQYFNPQATGYIGKQIIAMANGSPIHGPLVHLVPHATFVGAVVAFGELAIGIGTLLGLLLRPAAFFGLLLSLIFFLSASWHVYPYFYGADIVFIFCWMTILLAGLRGSWLPSVDAYLAARLIARATPEQQTWLVPALQFLLGADKQEQGMLATSSVQDIHAQNRSSAANIANRPNNYRKQVALMHAQETRRNFLWGLGAGSVGMLGLIWLGNVLHILPGSSDTQQNPGSATSGTGDGSTSSANMTQSAGGPGTIAQISAVPANSATTFTIPSNGDPGVLIHLNNGKFVAFDATCTHAGCPVQFDPGSGHLLCPCHGAEFDPANNASVVQGPTNTPLTGVPIVVNNSTGTISLK